MKGRNTSVIGIRVSDETYGILLEQADKLSKTVSSLIKEKVEDYARKLYSRSVNHNNEENEVHSVNRRQWRPGGKYKAGEEVEYKGKIIIAQEVDADGNTF